MCISTNCVQAGSHVQIFAQFIYCREMIKFLIPQNGNKVLYTLFFVCLQYKSLIVAEKRSKKHGMSQHMGKQTICICEKKDEDQLCSNCTADQRLCFHSIDSTMSPLP